MKTGTLVFVILVLAAALASAQQPAATSPALGAAAQAAASPIPDGTLVKVEMKQDVPTQKAKVGDPVKIEVIEDGKTPEGKTALGPDGKPAVPRKTKLTAKVTSVKANTKESKGAKLSLVVVAATFPNGKAMPFLGVVMGPFRVSNLTSGTGIDTRGGGAASKDTLRLDTPDVPSGIEGVNLRIDPQLGTMLIAPNNFDLENGTQFHVRYVDPAAHPAETQPPAK